MRISEILNEEAGCKTCGGSGTVHWDHTDEWTGDHVPAEAPCPDCKEELEEIKVTKTLAGKRVTPSRDLAMKRKKKSPNQGKPACEIKNKNMKQLADITLKGEY